MPNASSPEDIDELGRVIEFNFPDKLSHFCNPGIIVSRRWPSQFFSIDDHRSELKDSKKLSESSYPDSPVKCEAPIFSLDQNGYGQQYRNKLLGILNESELRMLLSIACDDIPGPILTHPINSQDFKAFFRIVIGNN